jgi:hypothetical protein
MPALITPAGDDHFRALPGEGDGGGAPDAGESTGDQDNLRTHSTILCCAAGNPTAFRWTRIIYPMNQQKARKRIWLIPAEP